MDKHLIVNIEAYRTEDAAETYSSYQLFPIEKYLFGKYYREDDRILDLACGGGRTTLRLHELGYKNVKGVDLSDVLINMAQSRFPYLKFEIGSYTDLGEESGSYDHVLISHNGIDYAFPESEREKAFAECHRVLKKGGTFILSGHNIKSILFTPYAFSSGSRLLWKLRNTFHGFSTKAYVYDLGMYTFYASPEYIIGRIERYGFELVEERGFRQSANKWFNKYISPYVHFVFRKVKE